MSFGFFSITAPTSTRVAVMAQQHGCSRAAVASTKSRRCSNRSARKHSVSLPLICCSLRAAEVTSKPRVISRRLHVLAALEPSDHQLLIEAATLGKEATVSACIAAGFPVNTTDASGATALHYSALHGRARQVRMLLEAGAATDIRDERTLVDTAGMGVLGGGFCRRRRWRLRRLRARTARSRRASAGRRTPTRSTKVCESHRSFFTMSWR